LWTGENWDQSAARRERFTFQVETAASSNQRVDPFGSAAFTKDSRTKRPNRRPGWCPAAADRNVGQNSTMKAKALFLSLIVVVTTCGATVISSSPLLEPFSVRVTLSKPGPQFRGPNSPAPSKQPLPEFPLRMRRAKISDEVVVSFTVETDGRMSDIRIIKQSHQKDFDDAALDAVKLWRFELPKGEKFVRTMFEYSIRFEIHEE
jgi:TonB family protein